MTDAYNTIHAVRSWELEHPKPVKNLLECADALDNVSTDQPDWSGLFDPKKVAATVEEHARYLALNQTSQHAGSPTATAVAAARSRIATELVREISESLDFYTEQMEPVFDAAAEAYEAAAGKLPREFTADEVTSFDAEQFDAYQSAKAAAATLEAAKAFMLRISAMIPEQRFNAAATAHDFLILDPGTVRVYAGVQTSEFTGVDNAYRAVSPSLLKAVKEGATLRLALPSEATDAVAGYEQSRAELSLEEWNRIRTSLTTW